MPAFCSVLISCRSFFQEKRKICRFRDWINCFCFLLVHAVCRPYARGKKQFSSASCNVVSEHGDSSLIIRSFLHEIYKMNLLDRMTLKSFFETFIVSILFFLMIIELLDLFSNLWRYINNNVPLIEILKVSLLYAPKCIFYALPVLKTKSY